MLLKNEEKRSSAFITFSAFSSILCVWLCATANYLCILHIAPNYFVLCVWAHIRFNTCLMNFPRNGSITDARIKIENVH